MLKEFGKKLTLKPTSAWNSLKKEHVRRTSMQQSLPEFISAKYVKGLERTGSLVPEVKGRKSHERSGSLKPLPIIPPSAPRNLHARRPTGPRELPSIVQSAVEKRTSLSTVLDNEKELVETLSHLMQLLTSFTACDDPRLGDSIREKIRDLKTAMASFTEDALQIVTNVTIFANIERC